MDSQAVRDVIRAAGRANVAKACGVSPQAVSRWIRNGEVPVERVRYFCDFTGMRPELVNRVMREALR